MPEPAAYIAGIGISPWSWPRTSLSFLKTKTAVQQLAISAGTKALLDAGISYDDVDRAIGCGDLGSDRDIFYTFGKTGIPIHEIDKDSGLYAATNFINSGNAHCVLIISLDQNAAVGVVVSSEAFIWRRPYLKDAAIAVRGSALGSPIKGFSTMKFVVDEAFRKANIGPSDIQIVESNAGSALDDLDVARNVQTWSATTSSTGLCEIVWLLRGWTQGDLPSKTHNCLQCTLTPNGTATAAVFSRADGQAAPSYEEVEHRNDSRERFQYNPAAETKEVSMEDWEAVKSRAEYSDDDAATKVQFNRKGGDRAALAKL